MFHLQPKRNFRNLLVNGKRPSFPPGRDDLVPFPLEHISHQELPDKMLKDLDEVAVLNAVSCFMWGSLTYIQFFLDIYERNLRPFLAGECAN